MENISNLKNQKIVMRADFNVPMKKGAISDPFKIERTIQDIKMLMENNNRVVLLSHLGKVKTEEDRNKTLKPIAEEIANQLGHPVKFIDACYGDKVREEVEKSSLGEVIVLENTRHMDLCEKAESNNSEELARYWASLGDIFVFDAPGSAHRAHASTAGISKFLPTLVGNLVQEEIDNLSVLNTDTPHPFTVFMGGAKVDDKLNMISEILKRCDALLVGGGIANSFLKAKGANIGQSLATNDEEILEKLRELMQKYPGKIILPVDFTIDEGSIYDIGEKSIELFKKYINASKIVFVNGTCGLYEDVRFQEGTKGLFQALKESPAEVIIGGGDTTAAVHKYGYENDYKFLSTGGGATLEYIADGKWQAIEWIEKNGIHSMQSEKSDDQTRSRVLPE